MDTIRIETADEKIVLNFRREVGDIRKIRHLTKGEAIALGLLMTAQAAEQAVNFDANPELSLQVINAPYQEAFLSVLDPHCGRTLIICIQGGLVAEIGLHLLLLGRDGTEGVPAFVRQVSYCYLEGAGEG